MAIALASPFPLPAPIAVPLPEGWGEAWLDPPGRPPRQESVRAYAADGWRLSWLPTRMGMGIAGCGCDAERGGEPPAALVQRFGGAGDQFWQAWVVAEACAKAADLPILAWLGRHGLAAVPGFAVHEAVVATAHGPVFVALARAPLG